MVQFVAALFHVLRPLRSVLCATVILATPLISRAQTILYITNGDASALQAINTSTGQIVFSTTTSPLAYPIAVRGTIKLGHRDSPGLTGEYSLGDGSLIGSLQTHVGTPNWSQSVDGAVNGNFNYTLAAFTGSTTVYQTDANWGNSLPLFTLSGNSFVGITFDSASGNLWISESGKFSQYSLGGTLVSQFTVTNAYGALAYQFSTNTLWFVPNDPGLPLQQYAKNGMLLTTLTVAGRSGNVFGAEFTAIPEPSTHALMALGLGLLLWFRRRS